MAKLLDSISTFSTGDVIITYYPAVQGRPLHFTFFIAPRDAPDGKACFAHAGSDQVELSPASDYATMPKFIHAQYADEKIRSTAAVAAKTWATTVKRTPYGKYPSSDMFSGRADINLSRYRGMRDTPNLAAIPFEPASLLRAFKWTSALVTQTTLSEHRGITCAAFAGACYQAAAVKEYLSTTSIDPRTLPEMIGELSKAFADKPSKLLELIEPDQPDPNQKKFRIGQALRQNSNRPLKQAAITRLNAENTLTSPKFSYVPYMFNEKEEFIGNMPDVDHMWRLMQKNIMKINKFSTVPLGKLLPDDLQFDAKYINSNIFTNLIMGSPRWAKSYYD